MPFSREPLAVLLDRAYSNYLSLFKPLDKTPRYNLLRVFASADAGMYHQLLGDLGFLADQIFPDTATGEYLRLHWSDRVPPLYAISAAGTIEISGVPNAAVPAGLVYASAAGQRYFTGSAYRIGEDGTAAARVKAEASGADTNLASGENLSLISSIPPGIDSTAVTVGDGITGGADGETDEAYLARVLQALRNATRYGKPGDFADWAVDASPEVSKAWEFKNFGVFGALLIQVAGGNQLDGITPVGNPALVSEYISTVAPPVLFTVRTPELLPLDPVIALLPVEDFTANRKIVESRLRTYLQATAIPGTQYTAGMLREAIIDGVIISGATVKLNGSATGKITATILQLPVLGELTWE
ncbi:MAG: baseplate J/gp47 family protein [Treponema sp.]|jgi:hypothetical protein|nr:baseplate J/gp47 family protein [Treponema sp.]